MWLQVKVYMYEMMRLTIMTDGLNDGVTCEDDMNYFTAGLFLILIIF